MHEESEKKKPQKPEDRKWIKFLNNSGCKEDILEQHFFFFWNLEVQLATLKAQNVIPDMHLKAENENYTHHTHSRARTHARAGTQSLTHRYSGIYVNVYLILTCINIYFQWRCFNK